MSAFGPVYLLDFEGSTASGVVEFGIVEFSGTDILRTWTGLCAPTGRIGQAERMTHHLPDHALAGQPPFRDYWNLFSSLRRQGPFGAHSASVEDRMITSTWPTPGKVPAFDREPPGDSLHWGPWLDTLAVSRICYPDFPDHTLSGMIRRLNLTDDLEQLAVQHCPPARRGFHCALYDALGAALILRHIRRASGWERVPMSWFVNGGSSDRGRGQTVLPFS